MFVSLLRDGFLVTGMLTKAFFKLKKWNVKKPFDPEKSGEGGISVQPSGSLYKDLLEFRVLIRSVIFMKRSLFYRKMQMYACGFLKRPGF